MLDRIDIHLEMPAVKFEVLLDRAGGKLIEHAMSRLGLSARAYARLLKVARTIADLEGSAAIASAHVAEAIQYRSLDRPLQGLGVEKSAPRRLHHEVHGEHEGKKRQNANAIKKTLRARSAARAYARERLHIIESPNFAGTWVYTKGTIRRKGGGRGFLCPHIVEARRVNRRVPRVRARRVEAGG